MRPEPLPYNVKNPKVIRELTPEPKRQKSVSKKKSRLVWRVKKIGATSAVP